MTRWAALRAAARGAVFDDGPADRDEAGRRHDALTQFRSIATPRTVLALLVELQQAKRQLELDFREMASRRTVLANLKAAQNGWIEAFRAAVWQQNRADILLIERDRLAAQIAQAREVLEKAGAQFAHYALLHYQKGTPDGVRKGDTNRDLAHEIMAALAAMKEDSDACGDRRQMKIYRVHMGGDFGNCDSKAIWFTNKAEAPKHIQDLYDSLATGDTPESHPRPKMETFDVPTNKAGLVAFLNQWCDR